MEHHAFRPDCSRHGHFSKSEARELINAGKVRFVSPRAVVAVSSVPPSGYWYDEVAKKDDRRYLGTARSGTARMGRHTTAGEFHAVRDEAQSQGHRGLWCSPAPNVRRGNQWREEDHRGSSK